MNAQTELRALVISTLQTQEASIQAIKVLAAALIATHPDHKALLESYLSFADVVADSVETGSIPLYRKEIHDFQNLMLDWVNRPT